MWEKSIEPFIVYFQHIKFFFYALWEDYLLIL